MTTELPVYSFTRQFAAPPALVWRTWTEADLLARWYGPGVETIIHELDVRPGGRWLNEMKWGENSMYQKGEYLEVDPPNRLIWLHTTCDANWQPAANPKMPDWPKTLLTTVDFEAGAGGTSVRLTWEPYQANEAEIACFAESVSAMGQGWGAGMDVLAEMLAELQG